MKKMIFTLLAGVAISNAQGQALDLGMQGGFGTTWMLNSNVSDQGPNLDPKASFAPVFGVRAGYFFKSNMGVFIEGNYAVIRQDYKGDISSTASYTSMDKVKYIEVPLFFHITGKVFYFEIGPKFSFLSGASTDYKTAPSTPLDFSGRDTKAGFNSMMISGAFGIGGHFEVADNLFVNAGLRFSYGFNDATKEFSQAELTRHELAGDIGQGTDAAHYNQSGNYSYKATHTATGHVLLGVSYRIPTGN